MVNQLSFIFSKSARADASSVVEFPALSRSACNVKIRSPKENDSIAIMLCLLELLFGIFKRLFKKLKKIK